MNIKGSFMNPEEPQTPVPQPAVSAEKVTGMRAPTRDYTSVQRKLALILAIATIVAFAVEVISGYVWIYTSFFAVYALVIGIRTKSRLIVALGIAGTVLNLGLAILAFVTR